MADNSTTELQELISKNSELFSDFLLKVLDYKKEKTTDRENYSSFCSAFQNNEDFVAEQFEVFKANCIQLPSDLMLLDVEKEKYYCDIKRNAATSAFGTIFPT